MVKPLSPNAAQEAKQWAIPEYVIAAVNELLAKEVHPTSKTQYVTLMQGEVIKAVLAKAAEGGLRVTRSELFENHYLDFEAAFVEAGWKVDYDRPGYNEDYEAKWNFSS